MGRHAPRRQTQIDAGGLALKVGEVEIRLGKASRERRTVEKVRLLDRRRDDAGLFPASFAGQAVGGAANDAVATAVRCIAVTEA